MGFPEDIDAQSILRNVYSDTAANRRANDLGICLVGRAIKVRSFGSGGRVRKHEMMSQFICKFLKHSDMFPPQMAA